jgi:hypothetical protein
VSRIKKDATFDRLESLSDLQPSDRFVLLLIADRENDEWGYATCSVADLAARSGYDPGHIRRTIGRLEAAGALTVERKPGCKHRMTVVHNPAHGARGTDDADPAHGARNPAHGARNPAHHARRTSYEPVMNLAPIGADVSPSICLQCGGEAPPHKWRCTACQAVPAKRPYRRRKVG